MKRSAVTLGTALAALGLSIAALPANAAPPTPAVLAAAKTPAEHEAIAKAYEAEAKSLERLAARHESMERVYAAPGGKPWESAQAKHCESVAADLKAAAKEELALASEHRTLAAAAGN